MTSMKVTAEFISEPSVKEYNDLGPDRTTDVALSFMLWAVEDQLTRETWVYWATPEADDTIFGPDGTEYDVIAYLEARGEDFDAVPELDAVIRTLNIAYGND